MALKCSGEGEEKAPQNRVGLSLGAFQSKLNFSKLGAEQFQEAAVGISFERQVSTRVTLQASAGGIGYSKLFVTEWATARSKPGLFAGLGLAVIVLNQKGAIPFVVLGAAVSGSWVGWKPGNMWAVDARGSVTVGYTLGGRWTPYLVARFFGGPVVLNLPGGDDTGTDAYHYQFGAGLVVRLPASFDVSLEIAPLGEQRLSVGAGYSF